MLPPWSWLRPVLAACLMRWPAHQIQQQGQASAVALVVIVAGVLAGAALDPVVSSTSSTSRSGAVPSPWS